MYNWQKNFLLVVLLLIFSGKTCAWGFWNRHLLIVIAAVSGASAAAAAVGVLVFIFARYQTV